MLLERYGPKPPAFYTHRGHPTELGNFALICLSHAETSDLSRATELITVFDEGSGAVLLPPPTAHARNPEGES